MPVFILGAPRTGSTWLYQLICSEFKLPYVSNGTELLYPDRPLTGLTIQKVHGEVEISQTSKFGETEGLWQPSEASQTHIYLFDFKREPQETIQAIEELYEKPLVLKNAYNILRIPLLKELFLEAKFIHIKRDIAHAAQSDLRARWMTKGDPHEWNSVKPPNYEVLKKLVAHEQTVQNQIALNEIIERDAPDALVIEYENLKSDTEAEMKRVGEFLAIS